jgi:hypothetical protein
MVHIIEIKGSSFKISRSVGILITELGDKLYVDGFSLYYCLKDLIHGVLKLENLGIIVAEETIISQVKLEEYFLARSNTLGSRLDNFY